jgi:serine/threonine protein phosphatase PrpC
MLAVGIASRTGRRPDNQDFAAADLATNPAQARHGAIAVLADGVGGAKAGRIAAELTCRQLIDGYYDLPPADPAAAATRILAATNAWLHAMGRADPAMQGAATTVVALLIRDGVAHILHAGDSRAALFRAGALTALTTDHTDPDPAFRHILHRAIGMAPTLRLDHATITLAPGDRILLTSDGVHTVLADRKLTRLLSRARPPARIAAAITNAALRAGSSDNVTALLFDITDPAAASRRWWR